MLRTIRLTLAIISLALITLLFMDFTGTLHTWLGWMARIQFLPALLALNVGVIVLLVALTWVFGRIYCSVICPPRHIAGHPGMDRKAAEETAEAAVLLFARQIGVEVWCPRPVYRCTGCRDKFFRGIACPV